jgi:hypothetical protein
MDSILVSIKKEETKIIGSWVFENGKLMADASAKRIDQLITNELKKVAPTEDGWSVLYLDEHDGRLWELSYPESGSHGGGAPCLVAVSEKSKMDRLGSSK